jgi:A/G-specific adenine glycosylase
MSEEEVSYFRRALLEWAAQTPRPMPWKGEKDPYKIWLSEVILQQTRVEQGMPYYEKFVKSYPDARALAGAPEDEVLKMWEGLGYYSRARNLLQTARHIAFDRNGIFPDSYEDIRSLKGVGDYTAAAIASFAFNLPYPVVDGNVYRVLARFFALDAVTDLSSSKKLFASLAGRLLDPDRPGAFNQAIMDFGALCCTPAQPDCGNCPLRQRCQALAKGTPTDYPVRLKKTAKKERFILFLIVRRGGKTLVRKRTGKDIWKGLYEFPCIETSSAKELLETDISTIFPKGVPEGVSLGKPSDLCRQTLSHREITAVFRELLLPEDIPPGLFQDGIFSDCTETEIAGLKKNFAFPVVISGFLKKFV